MAGRWFARLGLAAALGAGMLGTSGTPARADAGPRLEALARMLDELLSEIGAPDTRSERALVALVTRVRKSVTGVGSLDLCGECERLQRAFSLASSRIGSDADFVAAVESAFATFALDVESAVEALATVADALPSGPKQVRLRRAISAAAVALSEARNGGRSLGYRLRKLVRACRDASAARVLVDRAMEISCPDVRANDGTAERGLAFLGNPPNVVLSGHDIPGTVPLQVTYAGGSGTRTAGQVVLSFDGAGYVLTVTLGGWRATQSLYDLGGENTGYFFGPDWTAASAVVGTVRITSATIRRYTHQHAGVVDYMVLRGEVDGSIATEDGVGVRFVAPFTVCEAPYAVQQ